MLWDDDDLVDDLALKVDGGELHEVARRLHPRVPELTECNVRYQQSRVAPGCQSVTCGSIFYNAIPSQGSQRE